MQIQIGRFALNTKHSGTLSPPYAGSGGWFGVLREAFTGAWQRDIEVSQQDVVTNPTVWACATLIACDISKLWIKLVTKDANGICTEIESSAFSPVLRSPNHYQTKVKFFESWMLSKLLHGNTYALKERNNRGGTERGNVTSLYLLDPSRVQVLVSPDGSVFYAIGQDYLSGVDEASVTVPASEIIHDIMVPLYHPLVGVSPIHASGMAAMQGLKIQHNSAKLFANGSQLSGVLTAPGQISTDTADRLQKHWESNYAGEANIGKVAVLGDGLTFQPMTMSAVDAQLIDQLKWSDERICSTFHVPGYKVGIGPPPPYTDIQSINLEYYNTALQAPLENLEELLTKGLELPRPIGIEFDLKALLRMDTKTMVENATKGILGGLWKPNEARADFDLLPVEGGDAVYLQQQQYSLAALNMRDQAGPPPPTPPIGGPESTLPADKGWSEYTSILAFTLRAKAMGLPAPLEDAA